MNTDTLIFESGAFSVVLTFSPGDSDQVSVNLSVRSHSFKPVNEMLRVEAVWRAWLAGFAYGEFPPLPPGWRLQDGNLEGATSRLPDHHH